MPVWVAWVDSDSVAFDPSIHAGSTVDDPANFSVSINQIADGFASATIIYKRPTTGIGAILRPPSAAQALTVPWALISWADVGNTPQLIFRGKLRQVPIGVARGKATIELTGECYSFADHTETITLHALLTTSLTYALSSPDAVTGVTYQGNPLDPSYYVVDFQANGIARTGLWTSAFVLPDGAEVVVSYQGVNSPKAKQVAQLRTLLPTLSAPYSPQFDPLCYDPKQVLDPYTLDPNEAIAAITSSWLWDLDLNCSLTDWFSGDIINLGTNYAIPEISMTQPSLDWVTVRAHNQWTQRAFGYSDLTVWMGLEFGMADGYQASSFTPEALSANWPRVGAFGGNTGWSVVYSKFEHSGDTNVPVGLPTYTEEQVESPDGGLVNLRHTSVTTMKLSSFDTYLVASFDYKQPRAEILSVVVPQTVQTAMATGRTQIIEVTLDDPTIDRLTPLWSAYTSYNQGDKIFYNGVRQICQVTHVSGQNFATLCYLDQYHTILATAGDQFVKGLTLYWIVDFDVDITLWAIDQTGNASPMGTTLLPNFLDIANPDADPTKSNSALQLRAANLIEHLALRGRKALAASLRGMTVTVRCRWEDMWSVTLGNQVQLGDTQSIPGGCVGKVIEFAKEWNVSPGSRSVTVKIAVMAGTGGSPPSPSAGTGSWATAGLLAPELQETFGQTFSISGDLVWGYAGRNDYLVNYVNVATLGNIVTPGDKPNGGQAFGAADINITGTPDEQFAAVLAYTRDYGINPNNITTALGQNQTRMRIQMPNISTQNIPPRILTAVCKPWQAPKQIDLAAEA